MAQKLIFKIISALVLFLKHLVNVFVPWVYKHTYSTAYNSKGENSFFKINQILLHFLFNC